MGTWYIVVVRSLTMDNGTAPISNNLNYDKTIDYLTN
nr:MAG TPA: hypothetical protein [Caudoviricetes sp.]